MRFAPTELTGAHWHQHRWTCAIPAQPYTEFIDPMSFADCAAKGGEWSDATNWEMHVWAWLDNPLGPFQNENPLLKQA